MVSIDAPTNCLPCLHAAFAVLAGAALVARERILSVRLGRLFISVWVAIITISIVALHQHTDTDVLVGFLLGSVAALVYTRHPDSYQRLYGKK
ncbi:MAG TPA: phosphatase PAP2 family protein [Candidatus Acidoferrales bacterium]|nr:phosphatase PAP2 family protein [Candidatus Acidoferrales bacterium]